jgi:hypothetical protein
VGECFKRYGTKNVMRRSPNQKSQSHGFSGKQSKSHASDPSKGENARDFARRLCALANERQLAAPPSSAGLAVSFKTFEQIGKTLEHIQKMFERLERMREVLESFGKIRGIAESWDRLTWHLPSAAATVKPDVVSEMLADPRIDRRRFARCSNCQKFYYKPRLRSRACSKRCEDALRSREHYWLEVGRRECALTLHREGRSISEIARMLGVKLTPVRRYLAGKGE